MNCKNCGCVLQAVDTFCPSCGKPVSAATQAPGSPEPVFAAAPASTIIPPGTQIYAGPQVPSGKATASLIFGILALILSVPASIAAVVLGHISLSEIRRSAGRLTGQGRAIAGLVLGYGTFVMIPFILIIAAIAIPNLLRARIAANEASAVGSIRTLNTAEVSYVTMYPSVGYTCELRRLGGSSSASSTEQAAGFIDDTLASGQKSGYRFELSGCTVGETGAIQAYQVTATPISHGTTGQSTFCSDQTGVIRKYSGTSGADCLLAGDTLY